MTCLRAVGAAAGHREGPNYVTDRACLAVLVEGRNRPFGELRTISTAVVAGLARDTLRVEVDAIVALG